VIETKLDAVFQNAEEGTSGDHNQTRFIAGEITRLETQGLRVHGRYWEKVAERDPQGVTSTQYRIFASIEMPEAEFKQALQNAARARAGVSTLSKDFAEKVNAHWDRINK
jgi:hypothetical protein